MNAWERIEELLEASEEGTITAAQVWTQSRCKREGFFMEWLAEQDYE